MTRRGTIYCSFCGRPESEVHKLICGPNLSFICDGCVLLSVGMIAEARPAYRIEVIAELDTATQKVIAAACRVTTKIEGDEP